MHLLYRCTLQLQTLQVHRSHDVEGNASCDLDLGLRSNQTFLVNAFPPKLLDIETSYFGHMMLRILGNVSCVSLT